MALKHEVEQGDCITSIAFDNGFFPDTIWNHADNAKLKEQRKDPNVLFPGDVVFVPDKRLKEVPRPTGQLHRFQCKNQPAKLRIQLLRENQPRANEEYELEIDDLKFSGRTDGSGRLQQSISPSAKQGRLLLKNGKEVYELLLGHLNPYDNITGAQGR